MTTRRVFLLAPAFGAAGLGSARAACDQAMLQRLLDRGFSREEINQLCGGAAPPATREDPAPPAPRPPRQANAGERLIGVWEGRQGTNEMRISFGRDGNYRMVFTPREQAGGGSIVQTGTWSADEEIITMTPLAGTPPLPMPGRAEHHAYQLTDNGSVMTMSGALGSTRLARRS